MKLSSNFLSGYYARGDNFPNLLARSVYLSKYRRPEDVGGWTDTIRRVVEGNVALDPAVTVAEAEALFDLFWTMQALPPGRGLWTGGVPGIPVSARYNCAYITLRTVQDWGYLANLLMCGCGVGVGLHAMHNLPRVVRGPARLHVLCSRSHPDNGEVMPDEIVPDLPQHIVADTRQGWVDALEAVLTAAFEGRSLVINVSPVRRRGAPIKTFGGISCGPGPLVALLRSVWTIIRKAAGYRLRSVEALDITNFIGLCIKSGNVRRSALIVLGEVDDEEFRAAKQDLDAMMSHRHTSNNSVVISTQGQLERFDWRGLLRDNASYGEPGVLNLAKIRETDPNAEGINPCFAYDTLIHTREGHYEIQHLVGKTVDVWDGERWRTVSTFQETSQNEPMLKITMQDGSSFRVTPYHIIVTEDGRRIEAKDVQVGEELLISNAPMVDTNLSVRGAYLKGFLLGDGTAREKPTLLLYHPKYVCAQRLVESAAQIVPSPEFRSDAIMTPGFTRMSERWNMQGLTVRPELLDWCTRFKYQLPPNVFMWGNKAKTELLSGLFDADGTACDTKNGFMYQLSSIHKRLLEDVQTLMKTLGVHSKLALMKSGKKKGYEGRYDTRDCWRLTVSQKNSIKLAQLCEFERLSSFADRSVRNNSPMRFNQVVDIQPDGIDAKVYCLVTDDPDKIACSNGLIIGRCGEIPLWDREFCCLAELYPARCADWNSAATLVTRYTLRQRLEPVEDLVADRVRVATMRIGVGLGGICDFDWEPVELSALARVVRFEADSYAHELGVARPIATTTVKPSGTISLLNGSSPGIHAPHAAYYIRRTRLATNDPMTSALTDAGVPSEPCQYDSSGQTLVFSFPMRGRVVENSALAQLRRQVQVQEAWADNAVSCTVTFREDELEELAEELGRVGHRIKSISCLPQKHSYTQPPYEEIDREQWYEMGHSINGEHPLVLGGDVEVEECSGGVCPVK